MVRCGSAYKYVLVTETHISQSKGCTLRYSQEPSKERKVRVLCSRDNITLQWLSQMHDPYETLSLAHG